MAQYVHNDEAPVAIRSGVLLHHTITVTNVAATLGSLIATGEIPHWFQETNADPEVRYPKAVYLSHEGSDEVRWTMDGQTPVVGAAYVGSRLFLVPVRVPFPWGLSQDTLQLVSDAVASTVGVLFEV